MRPPIRYFGGKWRMAPWIISHFPPHDVYVEPYAGGASVLLRKERAKMEVYNDTYDAVVNFFKAVRDNAPELASLIAATPYSRKEYQGCFEKDDNPVEMARRFLVKSGHGHNTAANDKPHGFRFYRDGHSSTGEEWARLPPTILDTAKRLKGVMIESRPALQVIKQYDTPKTLFYVDPPYVIKTRVSNHKYNQEMNDSDHEELSEVLHAVQGKVVLSGYRGTLYDRLFSDWQSVDKVVMADKAGKRTETLWMNFPHPSPAPSQEGRG